MVWAYEDENRGWTAIQMFLIGVLVFFDLTLGQNHERSALLKVAPQGLLEFRGWPVQDHLLEFLKTTPNSSLCDKELYRMWFSFNREWGMRHEKGK